MRVLYGAGGLGRQLLSQHREMFQLVADDAVAGQRLLGVPIVAAAEIPAAAEIILAISDAAARRRVSEQLGRAAASFVAPTALIGAEVALGEGAIICSTATLVGPSRIGRHFHCNFYSYVSHDCVIGDFVTFAPHVCCNGGVTIGDGAYIGANASIRQGITIGENAVIGMGAVVVADVAAGATVVGNPARARS